CQAVVFRLGIPQKVSILRILRHGCSPLRAFSHMHDRHRADAPPRCSRFAPPFAAARRRRARLPDLAYHMRPGCLRLQGHSLQQKPELDDSGPVAGPYRSSGDRRAPAASHGSRPLDSAGGNGMSEAKEPWGDLVLVEFEDGIAWVTMNRPEKRNAMSPALNEEMLRTVIALATDDRCRVLVLTGAGDSFAAGMDLKEYFRETDGAPDTVL